METNKWIELLSYTLPAIITGLVALYFFKNHITSEDKRRNFLLLKEKQNLALPIRLQAYERLTLFLERISPTKLLVRVKPTGTNAINYHNKLIQSIDQEFEHNLAQQIYVTDNGWNAIVTAKNMISQIIRTSAANKEITTAEQLRENIIQKGIDNENPTLTALSFLKNEVRKNF
ncbi:MAG: hypothetical protein KAT78_00895 [Flavobacteriaceae bacterium]|nr:hypothetical protein [Flavobacteriaceae bacterium]